MRRVVRQHRSQREHRARQQRTLPFPPSCGEQQVQRPQAEHGGEQDQPHDAEVDEQPDSHAA